MTEQVAVPFAGTGRGVGELTWGQHEIWRSMRQTGKSLPLSGTTPLPPGWSVPDMTRVLRFALERHPSLRTRLRLRGDHAPEQEVADAGEAVLEVVDAGSEDAAAVAERLRLRWEEAIFDYPTEWPVRMAAVTAGGAVSHMVVVYSHIALDLAGLGALVEDLATMDRRTGTSATPVTATSPLALAARQREPAERRRSAASLRYWEHLLRRVPARRFPGPADPRRPRFPELTYSSPAALPAVRILAARCGLRTGPLLMAACAVALAALAGTDQAVLQMLVSNRFRPGLARAVMPLTQSVPLAVDAGGPLPEVAARCQRAVVRAGKNAYYDPDGLDEVVARVDADRGEHVDVDCYFNDRRRLADHDGPGPVPSAADVRAALPRGLLTLDRELERFDHRMFLHVNDVPDAVEWTVCADSQQLALADVEALLRRMESVLVDAALRE